MINMIKADLYRFWKQIGAYVAIGFMLLMIGLSIYTVSPGHFGVSVNATSHDEAMDSSGLTLDELSDMSVSDLREFMKTQEGYQLDRDIMSVNGNLYYVFIFIAAIVIAVDFTAGCAKNTLTSAISRGKYFASKVASVLLICLALHFANTYITYFSNLVFNGKNLASPLWEITKIALIQLPPILELACILTGIAFMVKKTSLYNIAAIPLLLVLQLISGYVSLLFHIPEKVLNYLPEAMFSILANHPDWEYTIISYIVCAIVCAVFLTGGYLAFQKSEIK